MNSAGGDFALLKNGKKNLRNKLCQTYFLFYRLVLSFIEIYNHLKKIIF